ncbi:tyrosine-type recombinase/integrase [Pseudobacteriovorax antillogorgiicola]|uniref:Phage integrase family protein n=1 Tax=Pseudobacteriovorax antillogorgiicola TaxID=1513793 RepID=A0A1Y6BB94_9BACT|nr:tyrosine-type recombinase/integrase [Pseudobacteriovorax antillogorgiicola]TCS58729.1 phage integrase family protein [Pseudobacteriovorax antillogorgiicola]SME95322.1 Phage integrase family protein [Pseudobacteriovorax antillogorgiicola]
MSKEYHLKTEFRIESPHGTTGFRIRYKSPDTDNRWKTLSLPEIKLANQLYRDGTVDHEHTKEKLKEILKQQYAIRDKKKKKAPFMTKNIQLVEKLWEDKYTRRRKRNMKRPDESYRDLILAAEAAGMHPLDTCDLEDLEDYLEESLSDDPKKLRRRITWLNSILMWLGRPKISQNHLRIREKVRYLNEDEFKTMLVNIPKEDDRLLARIAFYTGLRLGEIFYLERHHIHRNNVLEVDGQMSDEQHGDGSFKMTSTKTGTSRDIFYPDIIEDDLRKWAAIPFEDRYKIRLRTFARVIRKACETTFGDGDKIKLLNFHCLRHCHAIWLLHKGASIHEVAQQLGNHYEVTYRYYSGFELKKESVERLKRLVD